MTNGILYADTIAINDCIRVNVPTVGQILDNEELYYGLLSAIIATPSDYMVQLDDAGIDFSEISSFELFLLLFSGLREADTSLFFKDLDLSGFRMTVNSQNGNIVLRDDESGAVIDRAIHDKICWALRKINHIESRNKRPGNAEAKKYMLERARIKMRRNARRPKESQLEGLIIALVNTEQFKYDYAGTRDLSIYQFNASAHQIIKKINYDNTMIGCYAGTVDIKKLSQDELTWLPLK